MKQAIAGVVTRDQAETQIMTVWPSIGAIAPGRWLGRVCGIRAGVGNIATVGNFMALALIPFALALFFGGLAPGVCRRYTLTNRRLVVRKGLTGVDERWVSLDNFDAVDIQVLPGQEWFPCGEMIFRKGAIETFRISGVPHPSSFKQTCLKAQRAYMSVRKITEHQHAVTA